MSNTMTPAGSAGPRRDFIGDLQCFVGTLRRGWRLIAFSTLVCATLAVIYLAGARRQYQATARVLVMQHGGQPLNVANNDPNRITDGAEDYIPTHSQIITSPKVVQKAIDSLGLQRLPMLLSASRAEKDPVDVAIEQLKVTRPDRLAKIFKVDYRAWSAEEATETLDAIVKNYQGFIEKSFQKKSGEVIELISKAREDLSLELTNLDQKYLEFRQKSRVQTLDETGRSLASRRLEQWDRALNEAKLKSVALVTQLELGRGLARSGTGLWAIAHALGQVGGDSNSLTATSSSGAALSGTSDYIRQLTQEQQQLAEKFGPDYARVRQLQEQIARAQSRARSSRGRLERDDVDDLLNALAMSLKSVDRMQATLTAKFGEEQERAKSDEIELLTESTMRGNLQRQRTLFNTVVDQLKQAQFVGDFSAVSSQIIQEPVAQRSPVRPMVSLILALAVILGVGLGAGAAVVSERIDRRIRSADELRQVLALPVLGTVPEIRRDKSAPAYEFGLICHAMPRSICAESYRAVRTNLDYFRRKQSVQVLLVTSPAQSDGKSSTASNFAISLAQAGRRVLLIDADLRRPTQHKIHGLSREIGLVQVLRDGLGPAACVRPTSVENLDLLASGPDIDNPSELLTSARLGTILREACESYDMVVVDSPPLLAVTDSVIISEAADGIVLVVRADGMRHHDAQRVKEILGGVSTPVLGALINRVGPGSGGFGGYGYAYGYGYGPDKASEPSRPDGTAAAPGPHPPAGARNGRLEQPSPVVD